LDKKIEVYRVLTVKEALDSLNKKREPKKPSSFVGKEFLQALGSVESVKAYLRAYDVTTGHEGIEYVRSLGIL
jgi:hypothetical protein